MLRCDDRRLERTWQAQWIAAPDSYLKTLGKIPDSSLPLGEWIWPEQYSRAHLLRSFQVSRAVAKASLEFHADNEFDIYLNGRPLPVRRNGSFWETGLQDVEDVLHEGENRFAIRGYLSNSPEHFLSAIRGTLHMQYVDGKQDSIQTGEDWKIGARCDYWLDEEPENWQTTPIWGKIARTALHPRQVRRSCCFRRAFSLEAKVVNAHVSATALGFYELHLNGTKVSDEMLTPDASKDLVYQTYDVTSLLRDGRNVIAAITGNGWYNSESWGGVKIRKPELLVQLRATLEDGTVVDIVSDTTWKVISSPLVEDDLQFGERYDARLEIPGWDMPETDDTVWRQAEVPMPQAAYPEIQQDYNPIRVVRRIRPEVKRKMADGTWLFDFGNNLVGRVGFTIRGARAGDAIRVKMYERFDWEGNPVWCIYGDVFYPGDSAPGGKASMSLKNMDSYICRGGDIEEYRPRFTYTGFRYAIIEGYPGEPNLDDVEFMVMHSDLPVTGHFTAGSRLLSNISAAVLRTYLDNLHGGPTDCPSREKNFWNGDIQSFATTACWYVDNSRLLAHWTQHGRKCGGDIYGWGDEEYILPWTLYRTYGDISILKAKYPAIQHLIESRGERLASSNARFRDHLSMRNLPEDFFAACYQCHMFKTAAQIAKVLDIREDAEHYLKTFSRLRDEFNAKFFEKGRNDYIPHCQSGVVLPLAFDLVPDGMREKTAESLNRYVVESDFHPTVGFIAIPHLLPLLCDFGYTDSALKLAMQTSFPSWGFMLNTGATTITENWWGHERGTNDSMNHFALGGIGRWFFEYLGGIRLDPDVSAFKRFILKPVFYKDQSHVEVSYKSPFGLIESSWLNNISPGCWASCTDFNSDGCWQWKFTIPKDTTALVHLPGCAPQEYAAGKYTRIIQYHDAKQ